MSLTNDEITRIYEHSWNADGLARRAAPVPTSLLVLRFARSVEAYVTAKQAERENEISEVFAEYDKRNASGNSNPVMINILTIDNLRKILERKP